MSSASGTLSLPPSVVTPYLLNSLIEAITLAVADASGKVLDPGSRKLAAQMAVPPVPVPVVVADAAADAAADADAAETKTAAADAAAAETKTAAAAAAETAAKRQELLSQIKDLSKAPSDRLNLCCTLIRSDQNCRSDGILHDIVKRTDQFLAQMRTQDHKQNSDAENSDAKNFGLVLRTVVLLDDIEKALTLCTQPTYTHGGGKGDPLYDKDLIPVLSCISAQAKLYLSTLPDRFPDNLPTMFKVDGGHYKKGVPQSGTRANPELLNILGLTNAPDSDLATLSQQFVCKLFRQNGRIFVRPTRLVSPPKPAGEEPVNEPPRLLEALFGKFSRDRTPPVEKS